jgi:hypothetical protein
VGSLDGEVLMMQMKATFNIFGYQCREVDLTPILGVSAIVLTFVLLVQTGM